MSSEFLLDAQSRNDAGKGASRRLRRLHKMVPAIIYGGESPPANIAIELRVLSKALENEAFYSHVLALNVDGKQQQVVLRDLQRLPGKGTPIHADFLRVDKAHKITMNVPLHFTNEDKCHGVKQQGGKISHSASEVQVSCLPQDLPEFIEVDMTDIKLDEVLHLSDLVMPKGVELVDLSHGTEHNLPVVSVHAIKGGGDTETTEEEGEEEQPE